MARSSELPRCSGTYPTRPVRLLVGFPPGGGSDVGARIIANRLSEVWGQQVIVENKPGAGGHLAIEIAAHEICARGARQRPKHASACCHAQKMSSGRLHEGTPQRTGLALVRRGPP